jgi:transcription elongation factor Elf1
MAEDFKRKREDFVCKNCGAKVQGTGYTDHCPVCLWSRHVDVNPGDRKATCKGMMEPVSVESEKGGYVITFRCVKCGHKKRNVASQDDNFELILELVEKGKRE